MKQLPTAAGRRRWGATPRVVRLDQLSAPQRLVIEALVAAAKSERTESASEAAA